MMYAKHARSGFSLIEILIAVAIAGIMAVMGYRLVSGQLEKSRLKTAKMDMRQLQQALDLYSADMDDYPESLKDLTQKPADEKAAARWSGPYIKEISRAPWGNRKFNYEKTEGQEHPYELYFHDAEKKKISVWNV